MLKRARKAWKKVEEWAEEDQASAASAAESEPGTESGSPPEELTFCYTNTNSTVTSPYTYTPLEPDIKRPIRLLTLLPGPHGADIQCLLNAADLDAEDTTYEALSYVWGDTSEGNKTPIQMDNAIIEVGRNLRSALLHLRHEDRPRTLWIDAVCINQDDEGERGRQVPLMGDIYTKATRTVVWLGCPCCLLAVAGPDLSSYRREKLKDQILNVERLFAAITLLAQEAATVAEEGRQVVRGKGDLYPLLRKLDPEWDLIFFDNPWWTRAWTLQEIVLAHEAMMCMGGEEVGWEVLRIAVAHYTALGFTKFSGSWFGNKSNTGLEPLHRVVSVRAARESEELVHGEVGDELLYYLASCHWRDCRFPHDKIYAVLGLFDKNRHVGIHVDYGSAPADVYRAATKALLERSGNLDVLGFCFPFKTPRVTGLPSWVPDWGSTGNLAAPLMDDAKGKRRATHASKGSRSDPRWEDDDHTLVLQGHVVDFVTQLGSEKPATMLEDRSEGSMDHLLKDAAVLEAAESFPATWADLDPERPIRHLLSEYWKGIKTSATFLRQGVSDHANIVFHKGYYLEWQDLITSHLKSTNPPHPDPNMVFRDLLTTSTTYPSGEAETQRRFEEWLNALSTVRSLRGLKVDRVSPAMFKTIGFTAGLWKAVDEDETSFSTYTAHTVRRRLGITQSGRLCLLPRRAEVGDQILLLRGGRVPVVLRPRGDRGTMEFIGEAFVYGMMEGEAFDEAKCVEFKIT